ncbi:MAG: hypothetical protein V4474_03665 [Patescibacteria group bacterium]
MKYLYLYRLYTMRIIAVLGIACAIAAFLYGTFLLMAVSHTARLSAAESQARKVDASVSALESRYLTESAGLTLAVAHEQGFVAPTESSVVYTAPSVLTVNR